MRLKIAVKLVGLETSWKIVFQEIRLDLKIGLNIVWELF
jgi:hypothetical protein